MGVHRLYESPKRKGERLPIIPCQEDELLVLEIPLLSGHMVWWTISIKIGSNKEIPSFWEKTCGFTEYLHCKIVSKHPQDDPKREVSRKRHYQNKQMHPLCLLTGLEHETRSDFYVFTIIHYWLKHLVTKNGFIWMASFSEFVNKKQSILGAQDLYQTNPNPSPPKNKKHMYHGNI